MRTKVFKAPKGWRTLEALTTKRYSLEFSKRAMKRLRTQLRKKHRVGITVTMRMHGAGGNRVVVRRLVVIKRKHGFRGKPAKLG